jgi:hypothetical protein
LFSTIPPLLKKEADLSGLVDREWWLPACRQNQLLFRPATTGIVQCGRPIWSWENKRQAASGLYRPRYINFPLVRKISQYINSKKSENI